MKRKIRILDVLLLFCIELNSGFHAVICLESSEKRAHEASKFWFDMKMERYLDFFSKMKKGGH